MKRHVMIAATLAALALPGLAAAGSKPSADDKNMLSRDAFGPNPGTREWTTTDVTQPPAQPRVIVVEGDSVVLIQPDRDRALRSDAPVVDWNALKDAFHSPPYENE